MPSKNYYYETEKKRTRLVLEKTPEMLHRVKSIDESVLSDILANKVLTGVPHVGWKGKCPLGSCPSNKRKHGKTDLPAFIVAGKDEGYVFHCCSCNTKLTTYKLLKEVKGLDAAEKYAQARWDAGELCGGGWKCPLPQKVRERLLNEKEHRRQEYRRADLERKAQNYEKKYGTSFSESS